MIYNFKALRNYFIHTGLFLIGSILIAQTVTNEAYLQNFSTERAAEHQRNRVEVEEYALQNNVPIRQELQDGTVMEIQYIDNGNPVYYITTNLGAARTVRTDLLWPGGSSGLDLTGIGYSKLGKWDGGAVRLTHQEFNGRIFQIDSPSSISVHATHVAGTLVSSGIVSNAKGMAFQAHLDDYDWNNDEAEMATAAGAGMEVSNHSYTTACGWFWNTWFGDVNISTTEDYKFGFYSIDSYYWDNIAYNAPNYLIVKAAGNDRNESCEAPDVCYVWIDGVKVLNTEARDTDGGVDGYDCIPHKGVAKNILTVGAITELLNYTMPSDVVISDFSSWGPADDGRIKPDIVAKGVGVYSTASDSDDDYITYSGTSFATPNVSGTLALLQQYYQNTHSFTPMRSATLKALALHTTDEAGTALGPDYIYGWGLMNAERAAELISLDSYGNNIIGEQVLSNSSTYTRSIHSDGLNPLRITICWTDPPGIPVTKQLNPRTPMLINDLDLRVIKDANTYYPWKLDPDNPSNAATSISENNVDNVEQVYIASPSVGTYTIEVSHDGSLSSGSQAFSIIVSGNSECVNGSIIYNTEAGKFDFCEDGVWVEK